MNAIHSAGPWRWEFNPCSKRIQLVGGAPRFDCIVMDFVRYGGYDPGRDPLGERGCTLNVHTETAAWLAETAAWLEQRAELLRDLAERVGSKHRQTLRDEAMRFEGRATLLRLGADAASDRALSTAEAVGGAA